MERIAKSWARGLAGQSWAREEDLLRAWEQVPAGQVPLQARRTSADVRVLLRAALAPRLSAALDLAPAAAERHIDGGPQRSVLESALEATIARERLTWGLYVPGKKRRTLRNYAVLRTYCFIA